MNKRMILFLLLSVFHPSVYPKNSTERRIFFGVPEKFKIPASSVVSIRASNVGFSTMCTGVLIGPKQVLSAAHCFYHPRATYKIGYGSTILTEQRLMDVENFNYCGTLDVALLRLTSSIPENNNMIFFTSDRWNLDDAMNMIKGKTIICGYGTYEGPDRHNPHRQPTSVLRCTTYNFSVNYIKLLELIRNDKRWPEAPPGSPGYLHDKRYFMSMSRSPLDANPRGPNFSTACDGDSGAPVFFEDSRNSFKLLGIYHSGPFVCGNATVDFDYDSASLAKAIQVDCF